MLSPSLNDGGHITWDIPPKLLPDPRQPNREVYGTLVLDLDGTLTAPGKKHVVDRRAVGVLGDFMLGGGNLVICTGATAGRIERMLLNPLYVRTEEKDPMADVRQLFLDHIKLMPENGSALLIPKSVAVFDCELRYDWHVIHPLHVPQKEELRRFIEKELLCCYKGACIAGDHPEDRSHHDYILSLTGLKEGSTRAVIEEIKQLQPAYPAVDWGRIVMKAARTTVDFVHADSGKVYSIKWLLQELGGLEGPVLGLGDLGDEFARVVPTINVNRHRPNEFRVRGMPSLDLTGGWKLLEGGNYVVLREGAGAVVKDPKRDDELHVLRDINGNVIFARRAENGRLTATSNGEGHPVRIEPLVVEGEGGPTAVEDAGGGAAWVIRRLLDVGYFRKQ